MGWFVFAVILLLFAVAAFVFRTKIKIPITKDARSINDAKAKRLGTLALGLVLAFSSTLILVLDSYTVVPPRNVGIQIHFGKAVKALPNGWHLVPPWDSVEKIDASVQTMIRSSDTGNCVTVRLANQTTACVDVTTQWNIDQNSNVTELFNKYRSGKGVFHNVEANVVERKLTNVVLPEIFAGFNPLAVITQDGTPATNPTSFSAKALERMKELVDHGVVVDSLTIGLVHYDQVTQEKLNAFAQALADTRIATQNKLTSEQQKLANQNLIDASSRDPGVQFQNCLNLIRDLAAKNQLASLPPVFNCTGSSAPVIIGK